MGEYLEVCKDWTLDGIPYWRWYFQNIPYWRWYDDDEWLPEADRETSSVGVGALVEIAEKHGVKLKIINQHVLNESKEILAVGEFGTRAIKLTKYFGKLVIHWKREPWLTIFKEFEKTIQPYARLREEMRDTTNRRILLSRNQLVAILKRMFPEQKEFVWYENWWRQSQPRKAKGFVRKEKKGNIWGWKIVFLDFQEENKISAHRFFTDADNYLYHPNPLRMRVLPEDDIIKNYLCFILEGKIYDKKGNYTVKAHLVIDLRPVDSVEGEGEIFFEAETELIPNLGDANYIYWQKLWTSGSIARRLTTFPGIFKKVLREVLEILGFSVIEIENRGKSFIGKCKLSWQMK